MSRSFLFSLPTVDQVPRSMASGTHFSGSDAQKKSKNAQFRFFGDY